MITEEHEYSLANDEENELIKRYSYDTKGRLVEERWTDEDGTIVRVVTYSFENNRIKSILTYNAVGKKKEVFQYNDNGEIHNATTYSMPSKKVIKTDFYEYQYY
jgi:YD repeat-containing protein